jgi:hypothetical protein
VIWTEADHNHAGEFGNLSWAVRFENAVMSGEGAVMGAERPLAFGERGSRYILRHCERSEAIQNPSAAVVWIASLRSQ